MYAQYMYNRHSHHHHPYTCRFLCFLQEKGMDIYNDNEFFPFKTKYFVIVHYTDWVKSFSHVVDFLEYLKSKGHSNEVEKVPKDVICECLCDYYDAVLTVKKYLPCVNPKWSLREVTAIARHLLRSGINILNDETFKKFINQKLPHLKSKIVLTEKGHPHVRVGIDNKCMAYRRQFQDEIILARGVCTEPWQISKPEVAQILQKFYSELCVAFLKKHFVKHVELQVAGYLRENGMCIFTDPVFSDAQQTLKDRIQGKCEYI